MKLLLAPSLLLFMLFDCSKSNDPSKDPTPEAVALVAYKDTIVTKFFRRETGLIASDNAISVPLSNGKVFWNFGDAFIDNYDAVTKTLPCLFQVRNAALVQPVNDWKWQNTQTLVGPNTSSLFKNNPDDDHFMWPGAGFQLGDTMFMYCTSLVRTGTGAFDFASDSNDVWAKVKIPEMKVVKYTLLPKFNGINFGFGYVKDQANGLMYAYGYKPDFIESNVFVARFNLNNPNTNWQYWDGSNWVADVTRAAPITRGASNSVYICKVKSKYVLVTSEFSVGCDQGKKIYTATSDLPTGPFTQRKEVYSIEDREQGHAPFFYSVFPHPEYINYKNELLITYCINGYEKCVPYCVNGRSNPDYYRARGIRVPLKLIDKDL